VKQALWVGGLCGLLSLGCSSGPSPNGPEADAGTGSGATGTGAASLIGTWDLALTQMVQAGDALTTITIGQDSLTVASPDFTLTATRTGSTLTFNDNEEPPPYTGVSAALTATQTAGTFDAGILPFDLGGSWTMQIVPGGGSTVMTCTLTVSASEIDGACQHVTPDGFDFTFTTTKMAPAASSLGDFGGMWLNTWVWPGDAGGSFPCMLTFAGNTITTCPSTVMNGGITGSPITGISFTYDGANQVSGAAAGWSEYSATRQ